MEDELTLQSDNDDSDSTLETFMQDTPKEDDIRIEEYDITAAPNDFNVMTIGSFMDAGSIVIPPYQRNFTWDKRRASKLIESLLLGLPVPQLFLYEEERNKFAVLDGQQRLMSLYFFMKGRFPKKEHRPYLREIFSSKGVYEDNILNDNKYFTEFDLDLPSLDSTETSRYHKKKYLTLEDYRSAFDLRTIRCVLIKQNSPDNDNSSIFELFDRLNTGGVNLKPQEIRANLYYSQFYQMIYDLNKVLEWRKVFGTTERDNSLRDIELILRAMAMLVDGMNYRPSMTKFLNKFSSKMKRNNEQIDLELLRQIFVNFCTEVIAVGGQAKFRTPDGRFSIGLFEAAFYGYAHDSFLVNSSTLTCPVLLEDLESIRIEAQKFTLYGSANTENVKGRLYASRQVLMRND